MRLCRFQLNDSVQLGFYQEDRILPLHSAAAMLTDARFPDGNRLIDFLPGGTHRPAALRLQDRVAQAPANALQEIALHPDEVRLLVPVADPPKILLLAGNYSKHIEEGGGRAEERAKTFPYVFMKPPSTTLTHPNDPVRIPTVSPNKIDWELELGVVIGRQCFGVKEADALDYVAGYTVVNDVSDRGFKPNSERNERTKDSYFDWLHGKWHDTFCPVGPCVLPADELSDPQTLHVTLRLNGEVEQDASTAEMIFPVAAIIEFISSFVTLQPGDIIATGTPDGVGNAKGKYLKHGDLLEAEIERIGVLRNPVV